MAQVSPVLESTSFATTTASTVNLPMPAGLQARDIILVYCNSNSNQSGNLILDDPEYRFAGEKASSSYSQLVFYKVSDGTEVSLAISGFVATSARACYALRVSGVNHLSPIQAITFDNYNFSETVHPVTGITVDPFSLCIGSAGLDEFDTHPGVTSGSFSHIRSDQGANTGNNATGMNGSLAQQTLAGGGATGDYVVTGANAAGGMGSIVAFNAAPEPPPHALSTYTTPDKEGIWSPYIPGATIDLNATKGIWKRYGREVTLYAYIEWIDRVSSGLPIEVVQLPFAADPLFGLYLGQWHGRAGIAISQDPYKKTLAMRFLTPTTISIMSYFGTFATVVPGEEYSSVMSTMDAQGAFQFQISYFTDDPSL